MSVVAFEYLAQQVLEKDDSTSCYELMEVYINEDMTTDEQEQVNNILKETFKNIGHKDIATIQQNMASYINFSSDSIIKFYKWLNKRLNKVVNEEWTLKEFFEEWDKHSNSILKKAKDTTITPMERGAIRNIIIFINNLEE